MGLQNEAKGLDIDVSDGLDRVEVQIGEFH